MNTHVSIQSTLHIIVALSCAAVCTLCSVSLLLSLEGNYSEHVALQYRGLPFRLDDGPVWLHHADSNSAAQGARTICPSTYRSGASTAGLRIPPFFAQLQVHGHGAHEAHPHGGSDTWRPLKGGRWKMSYVVRDATASQR